MRTNANVLQEKVISDLNMRKILFETCLTKKNAWNSKIQVEIALDKSGSIPSLYQNGTLQTIIEMLFPFALIFNNNKMLNVSTFSDSIQIYEPVSESNLYNYILDEIITKHPFPLCGSRNFSPIMNQILNHHIAENHPDSSRLVFFITNGDGYDLEKYRTVLHESSKYNLFWQFITLESNFQRKFISKNPISLECANNTGFLSISLNNSIFYERLYDLLLNKYLRWEKEAKIKGILPKRLDVA
ncbi:MAG: VWA domain-containing protein [Dehalobacterium sp.]